MSSQLAGSLVRELESSKEYFDRATRALVEEDSSFVPEEGMMSAAQQVAHVAHTLDWFVEGATRREGFDLDFAAHAAIIAKVTSLTAAREWLNKSQKGIVAAFGTMADAELQTPLPAGMVMGGAPKLAVVGAVCDHNAHHRGALSVYTRLLGKTPPMPYMEM